MHDEDGTLPHASIQHVIRRKPCRDIDDVQEHGQGDVFLEPVSYTSCNSFANIVVFGVAQEHTDPLHLPGQVGITGKRITKHPAGLVGDLADQTPYSTIAISWPVKPTQRLDNGACCESTFGHRYDVIYGSSQDGMTMDNIIL